MPLSAALSGHASCSAAYFQAAKRFCVFGIGEKRRRNSAESEKKEHVCMRMHSEYVRLVDTFCQQNIAIPCKAWIAVFLGSSCRLMNDFNL